MSGEEDYSDSFESSISLEGLNAAETAASVDLPAASKALVHPKSLSSKKPPVAAPKRNSQSPAHRVHQSDSNGQHDAITISLTPATRHTNSNSRKHLKFQDVANRVHTLQSVSSRFSSSRELRDATFKEWLAKKETKETELRSKQMDKEVTNENEPERLQKSVERMKTWEANKRLSIQAQAKLHTEQLKKKEQEEQAKQDKILEGEIAAQSWRKARKKELIESHRRLTRKKKKEEEKRTQEEKEKEEQSRRSYQCWKEKKEEVLKGKVRQRQSEFTMLKRSKQDQAKQREMDVTNSLEEWTAAKDKLLKVNKTLYTYKTIKNIHGRAWCPARSMQQQPTSARQVGGRKGSGSETSSRSSQLSYSTASFESDEILVEVEEEEGVEEEDSDDLTRTVTTESSSESEVEALSGAATTGTHKTIQVCCQTLQYWCTCY